MTGQDVTSLSWSIGGFRFCWERLIRFRLAEEQPACLAGQNAFNSQLAPNQRIMKFNIPSFPRGLRHFDTGNGVNSTQPLQSVAPRPAGRAIPEVGFPWINDDPEGGSPGHRQVCRFALKDFNPAAAAACPMAVLPRSARIPRFTVSRPTAHPGSLRAPCRKCRLLPEPGGVLEIDSPGSVVPLAEIYRADLNGTEGRP